MKKLPTQEYLKECFDYDPDAGILTWRVRPRHHFKFENGWKVSNIRFSLKECGGIFRSNGLTYRSCVIDGIKYLVHRLIWMIIYGEWPNCIDHQDGNGLNNRPCNLRSVTRQENMKNLKRKSNNTSGVTGVCWNKNRNRWVSRIRVNGKTINLGSFKDMQKAIFVREAANIKYGFHANHGRK